MDLKLALLMLVICSFLCGSDAEILRRKNIKIHVPMEVRHHKHTHTVIKNIHHYHKPRKSIKSLTSKDLQHEHVHHHYRDDDNQLVTLNENAFMPSSSNKYEHKIIYNDNLVNIENEALESLAVLQSSVSEVRTKPTSEPAVAASEVVTARTVAASSSNRTQLPAVARSRAHTNSRRRSPTTTTTTTRSPTSTTTKAATSQAEQETVE